MKDVAWALPTDRDKDKIGAEHEIRMNEKGTKPNETEMKNILKDWFHHGDMPEERGEALEVLIKVFDENGNKPLARDLRKIKARPSGALPPLVDTLGSISYVIRRQFLKYTLPQVYPPRKGGEELAVDCMCFIKSCKSMFNNR